MAGGVRARDPSGPQGQRAGWSEMIRVGVLSYRDSDGDTGPGRVQPATAAEPEPLALRLVPGSLRPAASES